MRPKPKNPLFNEKSCGVVLFRVVDTAAAGKDARPDKPVREYLILHYPGGHFDFPKGHVENAESERQTVRREVEEETGIKDVKLYPNFHEPISYKYRREGKISNKQVVFFLGETKTKDVTISHEHKGFLWLKYEDALKKLTHDIAKNLLIKAEKYFQK
jgi:8-oxo-dGTP pyrophosphatase MutT (NUDIX family)